MSKSKSKKKKKRKSEKKNWAKKHPSSKRAADDRMPRFDRKKKKSPEDEGHFLGGKAGGGKYGRGNDIGGPGGDAVA